MSRRVRLALSVTAAGLAMVAGGVLTGFVAGGLLIAGGAFVLGRLPLWFPPAATLGPIPGEEMRR